MDIPKVLWLKNHMDPTLFSQCQFFDLPDFLTYRATKDSTRSCCSVTCKCSFVPKSGWEPSFFQKIGLEKLIERECKQIGANQGEVLIAGIPVGKGLSKRAAAELGLVEGTPVGSGLIDARVIYFLSPKTTLLITIHLRYSGWLGTVAARYSEGGILSEVLPSLEESRHRLAAVAGTSTCHIVQVCAITFLALPILTLLVES
jgi:ribulose kinase